MTAKPKKIETTEDFQEMINLLAVFTAATNQLNDLQSEANEDMLEWLDTAKGEYASLQETLTKAEAALEIIARRHPEWFQTKKSIKTPYGVVKLTSSTSLEIPNEEATLVRMELKKERSQILAEAAAVKAKSFRCSIRKLSSAPPANWTAKPWRNSPIWNSPNSASLASLRKTSPSNPPRSTSAKRSRKPSPPNHANAGRTGGRVSLQIGTRPHPGFGNPRLAKLAVETDPTLDAVREELQACIDTEIRGAVEADGVVRDDDRIHTICCLRKALFRHQCHYRTQHPRTRNHPWRSQRLNPKAPR
jgi:hypothetical protein